MSTSREAESSAVDAPTVRQRPIRSAIVGIGLLAICIALGTAVAIGTVGAAGLESSPGTAAPTDAAASTVGSDSEPGIVVSDVAIEADADAPVETHRVALTDAPDGLAGFELTLAVESTDVATVANASYPDRFGMTTTPDVDADEGTITVEAVDLDDEITDGATDVTLARIDVTGVDGGETELRVTDFQIDADGGSSIEPTLEAGTITVNETGSEADTDDSSAASESGSDSNQNSDPDADGSTDDTDDSIPGFTVGLAIVALAAALLAHRP